MTFSSNNTLFSLASSLRLRPWLKLYESYKNLLMCLSIWMVGLPFCFLSPLKNQKKRRRKKKSFSNKYTCLPLSLPRVFVFLAPGDVRPRMMGLIFPLISSWPIWVNQMLAAVYFPPTAFGQLYHLSTFPLATTDAPHGAQVLEVVNHSFRIRIFLCI